MEVRKNKNNNKKKTPLITYIFGDKPVKEPIFWVKGTYRYKNIYFSSGLLGGLQMFVTEILKFFFLSFHVCFSTFYVIT